MTHFSKSPNPTGTNVNWNDPQLQTLLSKTAGWSLDNRGVFSPVDCVIHVGWGASAGKSGSLVHSQEGVMVVATPSIIPAGEQVRIDRVQAGVMRSTWGTIVEAREGRREDDRINKLHVYWIHAR
ncbi:hypothetical protein [Dyella sp. A6]|uniref:hypothetical protein n=1 Tax=Dyella aluminiiresistens TaxID=3069105 RepID=UPI002E77946F|nr:hypothetical protein [Dyella sp. A6]